MTAEMLGASPNDVLLVGIVGECFETGRPLSPAIQQAAGRAIEAILAHVEQLGVPYKKSVSKLTPSMWWSDSEPPQPSKSQ